MSCQALSGWNQWQVNPLIRSWRLKFSLAAIPCIPAVLRVRSQASAVRGAQVKPADASLIYPSLHCGRDFKARFFVSLCVSSVFPLALTGPASRTLEAGGVAGQDRRESSMDPASHTGPRRLSGQAVQDQLADGCLRIMTRWHLQSEQAIRLTDSPWPTELPILNLLLLLQFPQDTPTRRKV